MSREIIRITPTLVASRGPGPQRSGQRDPAGQLSRTSLELKEGRGRSPAPFTPDSRVCQMVLLKDDRALGRIEVGAGDHHGRGLIEVSAMMSV